MVAYMKNTSAVRFLLVGIGIAVFAGLLVFSALKVKFPVAGAERSEFDVIEYSLTDSIKRAKDGSLTFTVASTKSDPEGKSDPAKNDPKPCPT